MSFDCQSFENCFHNLSEREVESMVEFQQKANAIISELSYTSFIMYKTTQK